MAATRHHQVGPTLGASGCTDRIMQLDTKQFVNSDCNMHMHAGACDCSDYSDIISKSSEKAAGITSSCENVSMTPN